MVKTRRKNKKNKTHRIYKKKGGNQTKSNSTEENNSIRTKKCINTFVKNKSKKYLQQTKALKNMLEKEARSKFKNDKPKLNASLHLCTFKTPIIDTFSLGFCEFYSLQYIFLFYYKHLLFILPLLCFLLN